MRTMTASESRTHYRETLDRVVEDSEPVIVTRAGRESVVIVSLREFESLKETAHLLTTPANTRRLLNALGRFDTAGTDEPADQTMKPRPTDDEVQARIAFLEDEYERLRRNNKAAARRVYAQQEALRWTLGETDHPGNFI